LDFVTLLTNKIGTVHKQSQHFQKETVQLMVDLKWGVSIEDADELGSSLFRANIELRSRNTRGK